MAQMHNAMRRGPWSSAATAIVGDTREGAGIERLGESLTPTIDLWSRPDWLLYVREYMVYLHGFQAAVAAELSCIVFDAAPFANSLLVIDELHVNAGGALQIAIGYDARPAGAVESTLKDFTDQRARPVFAARPRSRVWADSNAATALTGPRFRFTCVAGTNRIPLPAPHVLLGNQLSLIVEHDATVNTALIATAFGRERTLLPSEVRLIGA